MKQSILSLIIVISIAIVLTSCSETTTEPKLTVATPEFHPSGGTYITPQEVTISCKTEDAVIRYTTDNSEPSASSNKYTEPIIISEPTTINAKAFKEGWESSETAKAEYFVDLEAQVYHLDFEAFPDSVVLDRTYNITVKVADEHNEPVSDGILIEFDTNLGNFINNDDRSILASSAGFAYTIDGKAEISWNSGTEAGNVTFNVSAGEIKSEMNSYIEPGPPAQINLRAQYKENDDFGDLPEDSIPEDSYEIWIRADIVDSFGNHTGADAVQAKSEEADVPPFFTKTDEIGVYRLKIINYQIGNNMIEIYANGLSNEIGIEIELVDVAHINLFDLSDVHSLNQSVSITASVSNNDGAPVRDGALVKFEATKGYFKENGERVSSIITYTINGRASIIWNSGTVSGAAVIKASVKDLTHTQETYMRPGLPAQIKKISGILRDPEEGTEEPIPDEGISIHETRDIIFFAHVADKYNNHPSPGIPMRELFETDLGSICQHINALNDEGKVPARFYPGDTPGLATITASIGDSKAEYKLRIYE